MAAMYLTGASVHPESGTPDIPVPYFLTPAAEALPRMAVIQILGRRRTAECPAWCVADHSVEDLLCLEDLRHEGASVTLPVPLYGGGTEQVMAAQLAQWPFAGEGLPYLAVDADGSGEVADLSRDAALAFADQLVAHAEHIRSLALTLDGGRTA